MPIYEYKCMDCQNIFEVLINGPKNLIKCSYCGSENLKKIISAPNTLRINNSRNEGSFTCCGRETRCDNPPCSGENHCCR